MVNYAKLYYYLFNALTDAITAMEERQYKTAADILKHAQITTEELYMEDDPNSKFLESILPFDDEQLYALWGNAPVSEETFGQIMQACRDWNYASAQAAIGGHFADLEVRYAENFSHPQK